MHHATTGMYVEVRLHTIWCPLLHMPIILLKYYVTYEFNTEIRYDLGETKLPRDNTITFGDYYKHSQ
jgi:hypothetical protein